MLTAEFIYNSSNYVWILIFGMMPKDSGLIVMCIKTFFYSLIAAVFWIAATDVSAELFDPSENISSFQKGLISAGFNVENFDLQWPLISRFYADNDGYPVWHEHGMLNRHGRALVQRVAMIRKEGLVPADYHLETLEAFPSLTVGATLQLRDLLLTDAFFRLAQDLRTGHFNPHEIDPLWHYSVELFDPAESLTESLAGRRFSQLLEQLSPAVVAYARLRNALARYQRIEQLGGWPQVTARYSLKPGMQGPQVERLRERLMFEEEAPNSALPVDPRYYDESLLVAVKRFQKRHGLKQDGLVGPQTRAAMNVPVARRIEQILANMERWRWLPQDLGSQYLLVNTAGYLLTLVNDGEPIQHKRIISGRRERQTPSFSSNITHLVVNPEWTVPRIIAVEDLLPKQQRDPTFLDQRRIQVFRLDAGEWVQFDAGSIDWTQYDEDHFPFMLRQLSGAKNSLGRIKFHMSNPYAIFLHDTPAIGLFEQPIRAFSSGCVRVQEADQLARLLLDIGGQSVDTLLDQPLQAGDTQIASLSRSMPVYLTYFTSWVDEDGSVQFRPDIYQRNTNLLLAVHEKRQALGANPRQTSSASF